MAVLFRGFDLRQRNWPVRRLFLTQGRNQRGGKRARFYRYYEGGNKDFP